MDQLKSNWERKIYELLRNQNYRITKSRQAVINAFLTKTELTIPEITTTLTKSLGQQFNLGSMYNNINLLMKLGIITTNTFKKNHIVYELTHIFLLHFICDRCQRTIHYHFHKTSDSKIIRHVILEKMLKKTGWSQPNNFKLEVGATCNHCRANNVS